MAKGKSTPKTPKVKAPKEEKPLGATVDEHAETKTADEVEVAKGGTSIEPTGKFEVVEISTGKFRMFNERGQAVSPIVSKDETEENGKPKLTTLKKQAARANALRKGREVRTPAGHADSQ